METGLKIINFYGYLEATPNLEYPLEGLEIASSPGPSNNNSRFLETESRDPEAEAGNLEAEKRVHGIHDTLETVLQSVSRRPVAPHKEGPAD